jgi:hypothetical protein
MEPCEFRGGRAPVAPVDRLCPLPPWYFSDAKLTVFFPPKAIEADIDHGHAGQRALLQELLWCRDEGETAVARFDHAVGGDHKRQILDRACP